MFAHWSDAARDPNAPKYDSNKGWRTSAQPLEGLSRTEYLDLARATTQNLLEKNINFLGRNGLSHVVIPHEDYRNGYEKGTEKFRPWLSRYCREHNLNQNAQVAIVGACVKDESSSLFKEKARSTDRVRDYVRIMNIFLEGPTNKTANKSIENMGNAFVSLEEDDIVGSIARKNYFHNPKINGFRAYKSAWLVNVDPDLVVNPDLNRFIDLQEQYGETPQMLAEVKFEHSAQQDTNRMTRGFMSISRQARDAMEAYYGRCTTQDQMSGRSAHHHMARIAAMVEDVDTFALAANNQVNARFTHLLAPELRETNAPMPREQMQTLAKKAYLAFGPVIAKVMSNAGLDLLKDHRSNAQIFKL